MMLFAEMFVRPKDYFFKSYPYCFYTLPEIETIRPFVYMCTHCTVMKWFHY